MDVEEFRKHGKKVIDKICDYYKNVDTLPPMSKVEPGYLYKIMPNEASETPESLDAIEKDIESKIMPGMTHWQSANFYGWYPCNSSFPAMLGDMYCNMFNVTGFNWVCSPAVTELETVVMDWLGKLIGLDRRFMAIENDGTEGQGGGVIQGSASESLIVCMLAAKEMVTKRLNTLGVMNEDAMESESHKLVAYFSDQTHSSGQKGARLINCKARIIPTGKDLRLTKDLILEAVERDTSAGLIPFFVCGTFGTTNTAAVDDFPGISDVAVKYNMWFHIDAAYAGAALTCPEFCPLARGYERADSFNFNPHK
ncbi:hypothetical protein GGI07_001329 [Coemansia sp. Benny D115]|nr:hypothetical protein GGI07_001329 [Coemansia sp. Benny D115]